MIINLKQQFTIKLNQHTKSNCNHRHYFHSAPPIYTPQINFNILNPIVIIDIIFGVDIMVMFIEIHYIHMIFYIGMNDVNNNLPTFDIVNVIH